MCRKRDGERQNVMTTLTKAQREVLAKLNARNGGPFGWARTSEIGSLGVLRRLEARNLVLAWYVSPYMMWHINPSTYPATLEAQS